jgi:heavy metal sensor kinase
MRTLFSTLRFRITVLYVLVFGALLWVFGTFLSVTYRRNQTTDFDAFLYNRAITIAKSISINMRGDLEVNQAFIAESGKLFPYQFGNEYIQIRSVDGRSLAHTHNLGNHSLPITPEIFGRLKQKEFTFTTLSSHSDTPSFWGDSDLRVISMPLIAQGQTQLIIQLGVSTFALEASLNRLRTLLFFIGIPMTLFLGGAGGWWLTGRALQPINRIISSTQKISAEHLTERLPVPSADDELRRLSLTLNEMFDRLERAFKSQQRFVADASHELKTPLTILQGELDVLRQKPRAPEEYEMFLASASEELTHLSQIIQNLLVLARADSGRPVKLQARVRLDELVLNVVERLQRFADKTQVKLSMKISDEQAVSADSLAVRGESELLTSLFFNLIHNAIKHSAAGQTVEIFLGQKNGGTAVSVRDHGTGIRAEELPHIFERFHRAENPSGREVGGTGLGLAISHWIAEAHSAKISVESKPAEGSTFTVSFPS